MPARYCLFYERQQLQIAVVLPPQDTAASENTPLPVQMANGKERKLPSARVLHTWEEAGSPQALDALLAGLQTAAEGVDTAALHAQLTAQPTNPESDERSLSFEELLAAAGEPPATPREATQCFIALLGDTRHFQYQRQGEHGEFVVRSAVRIAQRDAKAAQAQAHEDWLDRVRGWHARLNTGRPLSAEEVGQQDAGVFLDRLRDLTVHGRRSEHWKVLAGPLALEHLPEGDRPTQLRTWLEAAGAWPGWPAIALEWGGVRAAFPEALEAEAARLAAAPLSTAGRTDYRSTPAYSIDHAQTRDIDDALSVLEASADSVLVALHIAEPPPALAPGHPLFDDAAERVASVYTVQGNYPLFPRSLSEGRLSLLEGQDREAVTLVLRLRAGEVTLEALHPSLVCLKENLDYARGSAMLENNPSWQHLAEACEQLAQARATRGAVLAERTEVWLDTADPEAIQRSVTSRSGPVHRVVEELAIAYNEQAGLFTQAHNLPAIYRVQPPTTSFQDDRSPAFYGTRGGPHTGLGCRRYAQATSPIRRFPDLVVQRQLSSQASDGQPAFAGTELLEGWAKSANLRLSLYNEVEDRVYEDWLMRYLAQNPGAEYEGTVKRSNARGSGKVFVPSLRRTVEATWKGNRRPGDAVHVRVTGLDPDRRQIRAETVEPTTP